MNNKDLQATLDEITRCNNNNINRCAKEEKELEKLNKKMLKEQAKAQKKLRKQQI